MSENEHRTRDLDTTNCGRGVWLVKVPKYISEKWANIGPSTELGKLRIMRNPGKMPAVSFSLNDPTSVNGKRLPTNHKFVLHSIKEQTLGAFSQVTTSNSDTPSPETERLFMEGQIAQKFECQPEVDKAYMELKREAIRQAQKPDRTSVFVDRPVRTFKPISRPKFTAERDARMKAEGKKTRDDKNKVLEMLFAAFEKHQYYNIKDLQKLTKQPITYLKEILKEMCDYNMKAPHKNMWELKPEYRHYKQDKPADDGSDSD